MLSHEQQLLDIHYPLHHIHKNPSSADYALVSKELCYDGEDHAFGE